MFMGFLGNIFREFYNRRKTGHSGYQERRNPNQGIETQATRRSLSLVARDGRIIIRRFRGWVGLAASAAVPRSEVESWWPTSHVEAPSR